MSVRFVATEILSSADGLSHGETQVLETDEVRAAHRLSWMKVLPRCGSLSSPKYTTTPPCPYIHFKIFILLFF